MSKREKIIVLLMFVAIVLGAYNFFQQPEASLPEANSGADLESLNRIAVNAAKNFFNKQAVETERQVIDLARNAWSQDPFVKSRALLSAERPPTPSVAKPTVQRVALAYTGYVQVDGKRLAIINDREYETGEALVEPGYHVRSITPKRVLIAVEGEGAPLSLPLEE